MKKNRIFILGIVTMFVAILSLTLVSGTLARYTSSASGSDTVQVAKWDVKLSDEKLVSTQAPSFTFDLFETIKDSDGNAEEDVITNKIAPGTKGSFAFTLKNDSEVNAKGTVVYTADKKGVPLQFSTDGTNWTENIAELNATNVALNMGDPAVAITIQWRWIFDGNNATDTGLGEVDAPVSPEVTITVTFDQVD